jgi:cytochrome P450
MYEGKYTTMGSRSTLHPRVTKGLLNQNLESMVDPVYDEIVRSFGDNIPPTDEWVEINISDKMVVIVARASSRMFGGTTLSRNVEWIRTNIEFATDAFLGAQKIKRYPSFLKPIAAILIPEISKIKKHYQLASEVIVPLLSSREDGNSKGHDFLQWLTDESRDEEKDKDFLAAIQLKTTFAALHTSAAAPIQVIYDLCHRPEYIPELRKEIEEVLEQYGSLTRHALLKLHKLDSFMKESQRHNPLLLCTFERVITKDYQMSDGFIIPKGTTIGAPAHAIGMDGEIFPSPEKFDGFRFSDIRADATDLQISGRAQWVSSNLDSMHFGYGRHACPGRFFASQEIKQIMVHLLLTYDFKFPPGTTARPDNLCIETQLIPSHSATIWLRKRAT